MTGPAAYRVVPCGPGAVLVEGAGSVEALSLAAHLRRHLVGTADVPQVVAQVVAEVVPAARTVLVEGVEPARLERALDSWDPAGGGAAGPLVEVPVVYDGDDLEVVARLWDCPVREVVERHTSLELVSAFCGFAPGFAYLAGLPEDWSVPRLEAPRARVPAGAVAVAGTWSAVYPTASPGGWRLLGRTELVLWDARRDPPALLAPGTRVVFREVTG